MEIEIPITVPWFGPEEKRLVAETIDSGWVAQGPRVAQFEQAVASCLGAKHAVAVSSGTAALHLALVALGIGPDDEVIMPSFTFIATANAVRLTGAVPVFVDIKADTYNIDRNLIEEAITPATRAIIPVHQLGLPADMDWINALADRYELAIIEDGACALGSTYKGKLLGSTSGIFALSFHPRKLITTGEGGMIVTCDEQLDRKFRLLRHHGMTVSDLERHKSERVIFESYELPAFNYRMSDIQAAMGIAQMARLDEILARRSELARRYNEAFKGHEHIVIPHVPANARHNWQSYILRIPEGGPVSRDEFMTKLLERGIATRRGAMACHMEKACADLPSRHPLPETERAARETVIIPLFPTMTDAQQQRVIEAVLDVCG